MSGQPLQRALALQQQAGSLGFDWPEIESLWDKLAEEIAELRAATHISADAMEDELGDVLFMAVNLARRLGVDPSRALARSNAKFARRFEFVMARAETLPPIGDAQRLDAMEARWQQAKQHERRTGASPVQCASDQD